MMKKPPQLEINESTRDIQEEFRGYNHNLRISDNEFYNEQNMTADYYPVLSPRKKRGNIRTVKSFSSMFCKDALCVLAKASSDSDSVKKRRLYINWVEITPFYDTTTAFLADQSGGETLYEHVMVGMGAYLLVFRKTIRGGLQDGWFVNTENTSEYGYIDEIVAHSSQQAEGLTFSLCQKDGSGYENITVGTTAPTSPSNGAKWLDTSAESHILKTWSSTQDMWVSINTTYIKITCNDFTRSGACKFKEGDAVQISVTNSFTISGSATIRKQLKRIETVMIIQSVGADYIVVSGIIDQQTTMTGGTIYFKRQAPYMDYICESNNRLWGCRYGLNRDGNIVNEIYACKQGDFKNWQSFAGISTDSYAASVGSDSEWTGCIAFQNSILFFKENCIHKLFGSSPATYQIVENKVRGVQKGSEKSLCLVNETLFYKSSKDFCYYDGSLPTSISSALGEMTYSDVICGSLGSKIYISARENGYLHVLLTYDIEKGIWHKEDNLQCKDICRVHNGLYYADINGNIGSFKENGTVENDFAWFAETGNIGYSLPNNKYVGRIMLRLSKTTNGTLAVKISYDNSDIWETVILLKKAMSVTSYSVPIIPHRCDHFRLRIEGVGEAKVFSLTKVIEQGSDEYVY